MRHEKMAWSPMRRQEGVVIIAVLWVCAMIMWFALQISAENRLKNEEQVLIFRKSQALHLAIGGSYEALARMGGAGSPEMEGGRWKTAPLKHKASKEDAFAGNWQPDGEPRAVNYQTGQALVIVEPEGDKVNVNRADYNQLKEVMEGAGIEGEAAEKFSDLVLDFVDPDEEVRLHGAEKDRYRSLGLPYGPFNGPMTSLDQMLLIPGITQQLFYGYGMNKDKTDGKDSEESRVPTLPGRYSLFRMFTVYDMNTSHSRGSFDTQKEITWQKGGIYRILSCGRASNGPPAVTLWLIVRYMPEIPDGYEVLYRKIL